ncbi:MAG: toll/interleukin-1 receptor domain-containing protein, partial [Gammaproteobacteria bacterium]
MNTPFPAYRGSENFVFVCYSHRDAEDVYREIDAIHQAGTYVWYDEGIRPGSEWTDELAAAITDCSRVLFFVTPRAVQSRHCRDEVQYATKLGKSIVVVYLEPTELPRGLDLVLGSIQAVHRFDVDPEDYWRRLMEAVEPAVEDEARSVPGHGAPPDAG